VTESEFERRLRVLEQKAAVDNIKLSNIEVDVKAIQGILSRLTWLLIGSIFSAFFAWIYSGGLTALNG
jgi:hypothetical protein